MTAGAWEVHLAGEEQRRCGADLGDEFDGTTLDGGGCVKTVYRAIVQNVEGQKEGK